MSARTSKTACDLERNMTKPSAMNMSYIKIATPTGYINLELRAGASLM